MGAKKGFRLDARWLRTFSFVSLPDLSRAFTDP